MSNTLTSLYLKGRRLCELSICGTDWPWISCQLINIAAKDLSAIDFRDAKGERIPGDIADGLTVEDSNGHLFSVQTWYIYNTVIEMRLGDQVKG